MSIIINIIMTFSIKCIFRFCSVKQKYTYKYPIIDNLKLLLQEISAVLPGEHKLREQLTYRRMGERSQKEKKKWGLRGDLQVLLLECLLQWSGGQHCIILSSRKPHSIHFPQMTLLRRRCFHWFLCLDLVILLSCLVNFLWISCF